MANRAGILGEYLRARRELVQPEEVRLPRSASRRTPGLRREEVAALSGISAEYYLRLEQGKDVNPSRQVLDALARTFRLDAAAADYLYSIAVPAPRPPRAATVSRSVRDLVSSIQLPAFVEDRCFDVVAANDTAAALSPRILVGRNRLRDVFLDPQERALYPDWRQVATSMVASFRTSAGSTPDDVRTQRLIGELSLADPEFARLWARHDVKPLGEGSLLMQHPQLGPLHLQRQKMRLENELILVIYFAAPESPTAADLALLGSIGASMGAGDDAAAERSSNTATQ